MCRRHDSFLLAGVPDLARAMGQARQVSAPQKIRVVTQRTHDPSSRHAVMVPQWIGCPTTRQDRIPESPTRGVAQLQAALVGVDNNVQLRLATSALFHQLGSADKKNSPRRPDILCWEGLETTVRADCQTSTPAWCRAGRHPPLSRERYLEASFRATKDSNCNAAIYDLLLLDYHHAALQRGFMDSVIWEPLFTAC